MDISRNKQVKSHKTWTWLRKWNLKRETESLLIASKNNTIRTNYVKAKIDKTQQNCKCKLSGNRDEMINHIISEFSKLAQKEYKTRHGWLGKVIYWELYKKLKLDHIYKWYMYNPESMLENEMYKVLWDFKIQTDHLILARWPDLAIVNKKKRTCQIVDFAIPKDHRVKLKESKEINTSTLLESRKKLWNIKVTIVPIVIGVHGTIPEGLVKGLARLGNKKTSRDHPDYSIIKIGQNT